MLRKDGAQLLRKDGAQESTSAVQRPMRGAAIHHNAAREP